MPAKEWRRLPAPPAGFARSLGLPSFHAHLLYNRGVTRRSQMEAYLAADARLWHDPTLLPDMGKAVSRIEKALAAQEVIGVFGDFDTDGISATALLVRALRELGCDVVPYLPDRVNEGHGLNARAIETLRSRGVSLLVTVDCGSDSFDEIELASSIGMDTIVTDHHSLSPRLPRATALVNPARPDSVYPYRKLTGSGLAFKLVEALWSSLGRGAPDHLLELALLGTVADVAPLTGENRYLVKRGLERLNGTGSPGLRALVLRAGMSMGSLDTESLSFGLIPRLNAAGRLGDASASLRLLLADSLQAATPLAESLDAQNRERRRLAKAYFEQARSQVELRYERMPALVFVEHHEWLPGLLGLIAGSLCERYYRPVVAIKRGEHVCRASARSIPEFDIVDALRGSGIGFHRLGGHPQAAGFTMSTNDMPDLVGRLTELADDRLKGVDLVPSINIDCEISPALVDDSNFGFIQSLQPFGEGNPAPVFLTRNAGLEFARQVGSGGEHLKMRVAHGGRIWDAIAFKQGGNVDRLGNRIDLVYSVQENHWGGKTRMQLNVLDFRAAR